MDSRPTWSLIVDSRSVRLSSVLTHHTAHLPLTVPVFLWARLCAGWRVWHRLPTAGCRCIPVDSSARGPHNTRPTERTVNQSEKSAHDGRKKIKQMQTHEKPVTSQDSNQMSNQTFTFGVQGKGKVTLTARTHTHKNYLNKRTAAPLPCG